VKIVSSYITLSNSFTRLQHRPLIFRVVGLYLMGLCVFISGCEATKQEKHHAQMLALNMRYLHLRVSMRTDSEIILPSQYDTEAIKEEEHDCKIIDQMMSTMNSHGWTLCREEVVEMRAIVERARSSRYNKFQSDRDRIKIEELESRVKSKTI
jgi:hypothetical protein